uniref:Bifunctional NAD(P)H-hydrate repair enzyme n=1 Tax=uncultured marine group II/III euryarchaeote KM3_194_G04 TaxID=1457969 RepID=A0A075GRR0_9EURY|nr:sugar kinase [uncultured marine group II/III euryarchaeote KM3_194_G04]
MLSLAEFRVLDQNAVALDTDLGELMETAGKAVADALRERFPRAQRVVIACGSGNNGGDGFVTARLLAEAGLEVAVVLAGESRSAISQRARDRWEGEVHPPQALAKLLAKADVAVDALLGSGLRGELREPYREMVAALNDGPSVVAMDVPSGLGLPEAVVPKLTVTFHALKEGMDAASCGEIIVVDIGFPADAESFTGPGELQLLPPAAATARKGQNGVVAFVGGGPYTGAPSLAAIGAYRMGADLVPMFVPESAAGIVAKHAPELIVHPLPGDHFAPEHIATVLDTQARADVLLVGPGLGRDPETVAAVDALLRQWRKPRVVDADALFGLQSEAAQNALLTPHAGELARLAAAAGIDADGREATITTVARAYGATVLAKGPEDIITDGSRTRRNRTGHPRLAVGGTGDVLAGMCAAAMARGLTGFQAARVAAWLLGTAGERAAELHGAGFLATEVAAQVSLVLRDA